MSEVIKIAEADEFWSVPRESYPCLRKSRTIPSWSFRCLSAFQRNAAAIILFKITSADARNKIIEKLFRKKFDTQYNLFRNSLLDKLRPIDIERNEVVHWNAQCLMRHDGTKALAKFVLVPPGFIFGPDQPQKTTETLRAFDDKCSFYLA